MKTVKKMTDESKAKNIKRLNGVSPMEDTSQGVISMETRSISIVDIVRKYVAELSTEDALIDSYEVNDSWVVAKVRVGKVTRTLTREGMLMAGRVNEEKTE